MGNLGLQEMLVIGLVALVVMGPQRLPQIAKALGEAVRAFNDALNNRRPEPRDAADRSADDQPR